MSEATPGKASLLRRHHRRIRSLLLGLWLVVIAVSLYLFFFRYEVIRQELRSTMSASLFAAGLIYLLLGSLRGLSLLPATNLLALGILFIPPIPLLVLTLVGILISSASIYWFSESLHLEETLSPRHLRTMERLKSLLRHREFPIIVGWSFLPIAPTDLICYVCGVLRVDLKKCLLGVLLGEGAICAIYIFLGQQALKHFGL
ncbi:TVP38/TMEM64 family protein [soil metagenome]